MFSCITFGQMVRCVALTASPTKRAASSHLNLNNSINIRLHQAVQHSSTETMSYATQESTASAPKTAPVGGPYYASEIDASKLSYGPVKQMGNGPAKSCKLYYKGSRFVIETPWMQSSFGIRQPPTEHRDLNAPPKYSIDLNLRGYEGENPEMKQLYDMLQSVQDQILEDTVTHSKEWLQKPSMSKPVAEALFTSIVKFPKDKATGAISDKYPPSIKAKVPFWEGEWKCDAYKKGEAAKVEGDLEAEVTGRIHARAIIECGSIWFAGGKYGTTWNIKALEYESADAIVPSNLQFQRCSGSDCNRETLSHRIDCKQDHPQNRCRQ